MALLFNISETKHGTKNLTTDFGVILIVHRRIGKGT